MSRTIWPYEEVEEARTMRDADPKKWTYKALAQWFGCSKDTMASWLCYRQRTGGKLYSERKGA